MDLHSEDTDALWLDSELDDELLLAELEMDRTHEHKLEGWARHAMLTSGFSASEAAYEDDAHVDYRSPLDAFRRLSGGWTQ